MRDSLIPPVGDAIHAVAFDLRLWLQMSDISDVMWVGWPAGRMGPQRRSSYSLIRANDEQSRFHLKRKGNPTKQVFLGPRTMSKVYMLLLLLLICGQSCVGLLTNDCFCTCQDGSKCIKAYPTLPDPEVPLNNKVCKCENGVCPSGLQFTESTPCAQKWSFPYALRHVLYPTDYDASNQDNAYHSHAVVNWLDRIDKFLFAGGSLFDTTTQPAS